jgi:hypothetical protein
MMEYVPPMDIPCKYGVSTICTDPECVSCNTKRKDVTKLTKEQNNHMNENAEAFVREYCDKYVGGVREHGGNMWEMSLEDLISELKDEIKDAWSYAMDIERKIKK